MRVLLWASLVGVTAAVVLAVVQADNLGPAQTARISDQQNRAIPQAAQIEGQGGDHRTDILRQYRFFLNGWSRVLTPDTGKNSCDVPVFAIKSKTALLVVPGKARQTAFDGRYREGRGLGIGRCAVRNVEPDQFRARRQRVCPPSATPTRKVRPVFGISFRGVLSRRLTRVVTGCIDETVERARSNEVRGQGDMVGDTYALGI